MVFQDLSAPQSRPSSVPSVPQAIAPLADRFVALVLDFLIFSPVVSLFVSGLIRDTKTFYLLDNFSHEGAVAAGLVVGMVLFLIILLQTVFLYFWQATPGQIFLQLRVVSYPHGQTRLSINQCVLRSIMWCLGFGLLAVPFLEVASHPLRRSFHDRASDTMVVTLKTAPDEGPHPLESRFISSWMRMSFLFLLLFGVVGFFKVYHQLKVGTYSDNLAAVVQGCKEIKESDLSGLPRLDVAVSLYLLNEISAECLEKEADVSLWGDPVNSQGFAYLAKFITTDGEEQEAYYKKVCTESESSACAIASYMRENGTKESLSLADEKLSTTKILLADEMFNSQKFSSSLKMIEELQRNPSLNSALEKRYVRAVWALNESARKTPLQKQGRVPASAEDDSWLESFKERYEVP